MMECTEKWWLQLNPTQFCNPITCIKNQPCIENLPTDNKPYSNLDHILMIQMLLKWKTVMKKVSSIFQVGDWWWKFSKDGFFFYVNIYFLCLKKQISLLFLIIKNVSLFKIDFLNHALWLLKRWDQIMTVDALLYWDVEVNLWLLRHYTIILWSLSSISI